MDPRMKRITEHRWQVTGPDTDPNRQAGLPSNA